MSLKKTPLYSFHLEAKAKMVDFAGWEMPIHYGSQIREHQAVRNSSGFFDVSHMSALDISGTDAKKWLRYILSNDVEKLSFDGKALYSALLNHKGGVVDDLIVYRADSIGGYRMIVNSATTDKDIAHFEKTIESGKFRVSFKKSDHSILAVQGPEAISKVVQIKPNWADQIRNLKVFQGLFFGSTDSWFIGRTGYTGEDGLEFIIPNDGVVQFAKELLEVGVSPCGLGARDTLRLEAGMNLYGNEMDDEVSPLAAGMAWTIVWDHEFIGKEALIKESQLPEESRFKQIGLILDKGGILRKDLILKTDAGDGITTSGTFSPIMQKSIAFARVPFNATKAKVILRNKELEVQIKKPPFVRNGKILQ